MTDLTVNITQPQITINVGSPTLVANFNQTELIVNTCTPSLTVNFPQSLPGRGVPSGGDTWDFLVKVSGANFDTDWMPFSEFLAANVIAYDKDEDAIAAGELFYKAGSEHQGAAKGTFIIL